MRSGMLVPVLTPLAAQLSSPLGPALAVGFGFLVATFGHLIKSRPVILLGLLMIAGVSAYVAFVWGGLTHGPR